MPASKLIYPDYEVGKQKHLNSILSQLLIAAEKFTLPYNKNVEDIVWDGFYPHYFSQKVKVLFIAQESLELSGENYIDLMHHCYTIDKKVGALSLNQYQIHKSMLSIAYGINKDCCEWGSIPTATKIVDNFSIEDGLSFAFMNLSKLSNESGNHQADWNLINGFLDTFKSSPINYFSKQIELLNPDIIITMNLESRLSALGEVIPEEYGSKVSRYYLQTETEKYPLLDTFHFAAISKSPEEDFYVPIINALNKFGLKL
ncbi:hypothetical protein BCU94_18825 [Shewanella sp. 10N.286.52.C2]|uniref:hypothetical protein n=1 Tax=Shewanella sp. 10N.286.52.C2 TaxID=1880838 RepID=UPI000C85FE4E|nr:hypothetical protein [Shewanella sp. 10N.286.52.C2]PMG27810.1 hypothetical protein BCU94_18825 [Shewanella sp. 10N.286.52.C2]